MHGIASIVVIVIFLIIMLMVVTYELGKNNSKVEVPKISEEPAQLNVSEKSVKTNDDFADTLVNRALKFFGL